MRQRTGYIYSEFTNKGRCSIKAAQGGIVKCYRWVGEVTVNGKRHRFRSTNLMNVRAWVNDMIERNPYY